MKKFTVLLFVLLGTLTLLGCQTKTSRSSDLPLVGVSIVPEETFVKMIAGDLVDVITVIPPGYSPENYEPSAKTMEDLEDLDVYFAIGVPTEEVTIIPHLSGKNVVKLQDAVTKVYPDRMFEEDSRDPHIWLSIKRVVVMLQTIADELSKVDPNNTATYQDNASHAIEDLQNVSSIIESLLSTASSKTIIVFHPAFGYFTDDYGLTMVSLEEEGKEATPQHIQDVIDLAKRENIKTIYYQQEVDSSQVQSFAEEINGTMVELDPLASDYTANMIKMANLIYESIK